MQNSCAEGCSKAGIERGYRNYLHNASIKLSFLFSASLVKASRDAKYPATAAAARKINASAGSHRLAVQFPVKRIVAEIVPIKICAPNATSTAMPDWRWPCILPNSILRGNVIEDQVATNMWAVGSPTRHKSIAMDSTISRESTERSSKFFPSSTSRKRSGAVK